MSEPVLFEFYRGDDHVERVEVTNQEDVTVDITGWVLRATLTLSPETGDTGAAITIDGEALSGVEAEAGIAYLTFTSAQTEALYPTTYYFGLQREYQGKVNTLLTGRVNVKRDITRRVG